MLLAGPGPRRPYARYGQEPITAAAIADLRRFAVVDYRDLDARSLLRSTDPRRPGVSSGPYIPQRYRTTVAGSDHLTS